MLSITIKRLMLGSAYLLAVAAAPLARSTAATVSPQLASATLLGDVVDPNLQRDSCGSVKWDTRVLWTCRDTEILVNQSVSLLVYNNTLAAFISSSASYTNFKADGTPDVVAVDYDQYGYDDELIMYGDNGETSFYPLQSDECNSNEAGNCNDGTRFALWPSVPPTIASQSSDGTIVAYTFIRVEHITDTLGVVNPDPPTSLYRLDYSPDVQGVGDTLPSVSLVDEEFWSLNAFAYGDYGTVTHDGYMYLYAETSAYNIALAKVALGDVEDKTKYQYYVDGNWSSTPPVNVNDTSAYLDHPGAGGQGTYYWSSLWECFVRKTRRGVTTLLSTPRRCISSSLNSLENGRFQGTSG
ncbi:hypothetical protein BCR39DRAFT_516690 [Naematelia encephala]|uniref:DUF4185 domain-containing protein n=1 Tax=Naematelia encephala TaxID=71784 RepID=A0A1Y2BJY5_9TREE|nr:hypothetical protein BCR39DRAFT_516690 [Naematelia encephala]